MKIVLIRPPTVISATEIRPGASPSLGLAYVAAALIAAGHEVSALDAVGESLEEYHDLPGVPGVKRQGLTDEAILARIPHDVDLIGLSCMFSTEWPVVRDLALRLGETHPRAKIVAGGEHVTACPEYVLKDCPALDACALGEGEHVAVGLADTLAHGGDLAEVDGLVHRGPDGSLIRNPRMPRVRAVDSFAWPAWEIFPIENYINSSSMPGVAIGRSMPIMASRGCPYKCTFCSNPGMWGTLWEARAPEAVLAEMKHYIEVYNVTNFDFYDLTAIVRKDWIVKMARLIIDEGLSITWQLPSGTRSEALDAEVVGLLYESGCRHIIYAPESGSEFMLKAIKKRIKKDRMIESMAGAVRAGIKTKANFIVGFPDETIRHVLASYAFSLQLAWAGMHEVSFFPFSPYPGSELFRRLENEGKVSLSDEHLFGLIRNRNSYSDHIPKRLLPILCLVGMLNFFVAAFLLRPYRLFLLVRNLWRRQPETRLDAALLRLVRRARGDGGPSGKGDRRDLVSLPTVPR
jgi:anaerobic magnesium-protoporphyrin IX monomethyl ester cyclase